MKPFRRLAPSAMPTVDTTTGRATFVFNDESVGRDGHIVRNSGIKTANFESNPVILFAHDDGSPPIGRATDISVASPASKVTIEFTPADLNPFGAMIGRMVKERYLNAVSESWAPIKFRRRSDGDGMIFDEVDLLEISIVPVPALPSAVATARSRGIDTSPLLAWTESALDRVDQVGIDRGQLLMLRKAACGRSVAYSFPVTSSGQRAAIARALIDKGYRQDLAALLQARTAGELAQTARVSLGEVQEHQARCERHHGELSRRHSRLADNVAALPGLHRALNRALSDAGVASEYGVKMALGDLARCHEGISRDHDGAVGAVGDAASALGLAQAGVENIIHGLSSLDEP